MSCYFRHLKEVFDEVDIQVTPNNRKQVDRAIHEILAVNYRDCPNAWKEFKLHIIGDKRKRQQFIQKLKAVMD